METYRVRRTIEFTVKTDSRENALISVDDFINDTMLPDTSENDPYIDWEVTDEFHIEELNEAE